MVLFFLSFIRSHDICEILLLKVYKICLKIFFFFFALQYPSLTRTIKKTKRQDPARTFASGCVQHLEMVHCHLQDLRFLQLG